MQCLILTDDLRQAEFIQKGIKYENLSCDIFPYTGVTWELRERTRFYDGIFLHINNAVDSLEEIISLLELQKNKPLFILGINPNPLFETIASKEIASGYFVRPFSFRNIASEMKYTIFSNREQIANSRFNLRDLEVDLEKHQVRIKGQYLSLRNKEFALLHFLIMNTGKLISRTTILENVWDRNADMATNTVDVHISSLRKKINNYSGEKYIHTVPCLGYIFE